MFFADCARNTFPAYHDHGHPTEKTLYGMKTHRWPLQFFIFAYESDSLDSLLAHLHALNGSQPIDKQIDCVCVLDKGLLVHAGPDGLQPIPMPNTAMIAKTSPKALLTFYALLAHLLGQATTEPMALHPYLCAHSALKAQLRRWREPEGARRRRPGLCRPKGCGRGGGVGSTAA
jgi:hypothetical protein